MSYRLNDAEWDASQELGLMPLEARIFVMLRDHEGPYCPKHQIHPDGNTRKVVISRLRRKLALDGTQIKNIRGRGYLIVFAERKYQPQQCASLVSSHTRGTET